MKGGKLFQTIVSNIVNCHAMRLRKRTLKHARLMRDVHSGLSVQGVGNGLKTIPDVL
jgi:hypothetical protein